MTAAPAYTISSIASILKARVHGQPGPAPVLHLLTDSRELVQPARTLFFALSGRHRSGHHFIPALYQAGVRNFVVTEMPAGDWPEACFLQVADTTHALQQLVSAHRKQFTIPVVGITGSNGKTIVKEWLYQLLQDDFRIVRSPRSYNSQIGVPLSVWPMNATHTLGIFEAGISQPGEMERLEKVIQPTMGIFTNAGKAHDEGFLNPRQKVNEKLQLFLHCKEIIYCADYTLITEGLSAYHQQMRAGDMPPQPYTWTSDPHREAHVHVARLQQDPQGTLLGFREQEESYTLQLPFTDAASLENAIHCIVLLRRLGFPSVLLAQRLQSLQPLQMRLEMKAARQQGLLINDSYSNDLHSLRVALDFLLQQKQFHRRTLILSDIPESGLPDPELYTEVAMLLKEKKIDRLLGVGPALLKNQTALLQSGLTEQKFYPDTNALLGDLPTLSFEGEAILLKGARRFTFEKISAQLELQVHETVLEIRLNDLAHNLNVFRAMLPPGTRIMAMVKAFSYGSGSGEVAALLQHRQVDYLAVAYADEGIALREGGITLPIMVMNPEPSAYEAIIRYQLEPELYSLPVLQNFLQAARQSGKVIPVHLELETGMHRLGFESREIEPLIDLLRSQQSLQVNSIFSHLSGSEDPAEDAYTLEQIRLFELHSEKIRGALPYPVLRHILNTAGISRFPKACFDMVRLGLGLYGIDSTRQLQSQLLQAGSLHTTISQIKQLEAGDTVGYNRAGIARQPMTIATVGIGYADGYPRRLSNGRGYMLVNGQKAPVVGKVCMDMTMLDITGLNAREGDPVLVFGPMLPVETIAGWSDTISYEILTGISRRVKRVYYQD